MTFDMETYLFVTNVFSCEGYRPLHGQNREDLHQIFTNKQVRVSGCDQFGRIT